MNETVTASMHVGRILPEILIVGLVMVAILVDVALPRGRSTGAVRFVSLLGLIVVLGASFMQRDNLGPAFGGMVVVDHFTLYFRVILTFITFLIIYVSERYIEVLRMRIAEYYLMLLLSLFGMMLMVMGNDLLIIFLGIETMSVCLYTLVGLSRHKLSSNEGALKYLLLGAFTTGFFIFGIAMLYGSIGLTAIQGTGQHYAPTTRIDEIMVFFMTVPDVPMMAWLGVGLIMIAFLFKAAIVPFHWWAPDAYEGAPTTITAFMSTAPKAAALAAFIRVFYVGFGSIAVEWTTVLWWLAVLTMTFGNLLALRQESVKRMLAFSSITHAGYLLVAFIAFRPGATDQNGASAILFYLAVYAIMNVGAFVVAMAVNKNEDEDKGYSYDDYKGLASRKPLMAFLMMIFMLSLTGIPPTAGFFGKYYLLRAAVDAGYVGLAVIAVLNSAVSVYYYLRPVVNMYMRKADDERPPALAFNLDLAAVAVLCAILVLAIGIRPGMLLNAAQVSVLSLM